MMRVLVLCEYPSLNGGEHSLLAVAKCLQRQCVEWLFAAPPAGPLADYLHQAGWSARTAAVCRCTWVSGRPDPNCAGVWPS